MAQIICHLKFLLALKNLINGKIPNPFSLVFHSMHNNIFFHSFPQISALLQVRSSNSHIRREQRFQFSQWSYTVYQCSGTTIFIESHGQNCKLEVLLFSSQNVPHSKACSQALLVTINQLPQLYYFQSSKESDLSCK